MSKCGAVADMAAGTASQAYHAQAGTASQACHAETVLYQLNQILKLGCFLEHHFYFEIENKITPFDFVNHIQGKPSTDELKQLFEQLRTFKHFNHYPPTRRFMKFVIVNSKNLIKWLEKNPDIAIDYKHFGWVYTLFKQDEEKYLRLLEWIINLIKISHLHVKASLKYNIVDEEKCLAIRAVLDAIHQKRHAFFKPLKDSDTELYADFFLALEDFIDKLAQAENHKFSKLAKRT